MTAADIKEFLIWCTVINYGVLIVWFGVLALAHDWLFRLHSRWFKLSPQHFDALHYGGMALYKVGILLFNLVPLFALIIAS